MGDGSQKSLMLSSEDGSYRADIEKYMGDAIQDINNVVDVLSASELEEKPSGDDMQEHFKPSVIQKFKEYSKDCLEATTKAAVITEKWFNLISTQYESTATKIGEVQASLKLNQNQLAEESKRVTSQLAAVADAAEQAKSSRINRDKAEEDHKAAEKEYNDAYAIAHPPPPQSDWEAILRSFNSSGNHVADAIKIILDSNRVQSAKTTLDAAKEEYERHKGYVQDEENKLKLAQDSASETQKTVNDLEAEVARLEGEKKTLEVYQQSHAKLKNIASTVVSNVKDALTGAENIPAFLSMTNMMESIDAFGKAISSEKTFGTLLAKLDHEGFAKLAAKIAQIQTVV